MTDGTVELTILPGAPSAPASSRTSSPSAKTAATAKKETEQAHSYWVTSSTSKIHNSTCRYYKNSDGFLTKNPQGIDCKICGGKEGK